MKRIKKFASMLLAMIMVLGMTMTAFAENGNYDLTIDTVADHTYKIYQLATGDVSEDGKTLSNMKQGYNTAFSVDEIINYLKDSEKSSDGNIVFLSGAKLGDAAAKLIKDKDDPIEIINGTGSEEKVSLAGGYYVIEDSYKDEGMGHTHTNECYEIDEDGNPTGDPICGQHEHTNDCYAKGEDGNKTGKPICGYTSLSRTMVTLVQDITMTPKDTTIAPDKKIVEDGQEVDTNEAAIGDEITYRLKGIIPDLQDFETFKFVFEDTMSEGLTLNEEYKVNDILPGKVDGKAADFTITKIEKPEAGEVGTTTIRIALNNALSYKKGDLVTVEITATLNTAAKITSESNPNDLIIDYSNNPNFKYEGGPDFNPTDPKGTTPKVKVETYTTQLDITKIDGRTSKELTGAEFELSSTDSANVGFVTGQEYVIDTNGNYYKLVDGAYTTTKPTPETANKYADTETTYVLKNIEKVTLTPQNTSVRAFVDGKGELSFVGLGAGEYTLKEVTTPDGYNTMTDVKFTVTWSKDDGFNITVTEGNIKDDDITFGVHKGKGPTVFFTNIANDAGTLLPSTGGIGTTIFYVIGGILVIGAGILLVTKKRMSVK